jgi:translation initiation factor IF-1
LTQIDGLRIAKTFLSKIFDGKVYIPGRVRQALNIKDGDHVLWEVTDQGVRIYRAQITKA